MIFNVPIEPLDMRYSIQWNKWFENEFAHNLLSFTTVTGETLTDKITTGSFLDVCGTNYYKASQLKWIAHWFHYNYVKDGDVFFFQDLWFPGIEMLAYMRDGLKKDIKIVGCLHDGSYDRNDFTYKMGMYKWAGQIENGWFKLIDKIFVATNFHKSELIESRIVDQNKIIVTGFPLYWEDLPQVEKENIIVFPHRLVEEKNPQIFDQLKMDLQKDFPDWQFIKTHELNLSKKDYYNLLNRSKIVVSFADQEYWGIGIQEALFAGCIPIIPNKLSYKEMYLDTLRFKSYQEAISKISSMIESEYQFTWFQNWAEENRITLKKKCEQAILNMLKEIHVT
jgi:glycosyltransferase involved in cell wall biosynthesis